MIPETHETYYIVRYENGWSQRADTIDAAHKHIEIMKRHSRPLRIERVTTHTLVTVIEEWENAD